MISYLVTVRNGEEFIKPLLDNFSQQVGVNDKIEVIIVDDGSTDNTVEAISRYCAKNLTLKLIKTEGVGRAKALNMALRESSKKYVGIMDVDDLAHPLKTDVQLQIALKSDSDFLFTDFKVFHDNKTPENDSIQLDEIDVRDVSGDGLFIRNPFFHSSMVAKRDTLNQLGGYDESLKKLVDYDLYLRASSKHFSFKVINSKLTYKRFHENQSFEHKARHSYIQEVFKMQLRWILKSKKYQYLIFPPLKFTYSLLPQKFRSILANNIK
ncbi:glycosyltransferase [Vibrio campbellii]|uniref:glycosyltransferase n=1 Tax=Vibrio campbellii TaxID=680 RepID=UPI003CE555AD